ncbi:F-box/kelch-repeat protein At3g23880-like [Corylus avellana]|uniref:F-box/kelch-repeat protein At3g23880-like n=1 Tax=Corylus avellana TaxID=13451 RepID=UPI00286A3FCF|nr:F-box/kelch-repeat protein At3g23880-like [Corylus avellana]
MASQSHAATIQNIPHEVITEILARLPAKCLIRFRCVCKSWRSLISDPQFLKKQLHFSHAESNFTRQRIIVFKQGLPSSDHRIASSYSVHSVFNDHEMPCSFDVPLPMTDPASIIEFVGSCNGLVCLREGRILHLWNPSTRESKRLPRSIGYNDYFGFGYDESVDDYKVVRLLNNEGDTCKVEVYELRADCWRETQNFPYSLNRFAGTWSTVYANGALYWVVVREHGPEGTRWNVVAFDLSTEKFTEVPQPNYFDDDSCSLLAGHGMSVSDLNFVIELVVERGSLCLVCHYIQCCVGSHAGVWIMREDGVWTKLAKIPYQQEMKQSQQFWRLLCFSGNGEFLMARKDKLALYSTKEDAFEDLPIHGGGDELLLHDSILNKIKTYVESLISPNYAMNESEQSKNLVMA